MEVKHIYQLFILLFIYSCENNPDRETFKKEVEIRFGKELINISKFPTYGDCKETVNTKFKFVVYVDGTCPLCITSLENWSNLIKEWEDFDVSYKFIVYTYDKNVVTKLLQEIDFKHEVCLDKKNLYKTSNKLSDNKLLQTFLLSKNKIVRVGDPTQSLQIKNMYEELIRR